MAAVSINGLNPFMPGDLLDECPLGLSYYQKYFGMRHKFGRYLKKICR